MGSSIPKRDVSTSPTWDCVTCRHRHTPGAPCPPIGRWLVLTLCPTCRHDTGRYCTRHRGRT